MSENPKDYPKHSYGRHRSSGDTFTDEVMETFDGTLEKRELVQANIMGKQICPRCKTPRHTARDKVCRHCGREW